MQKEAIKSIILSAEKRSEHPVASAIYGFLHQEGVPEVSVEEFESFAGKGITVMHEGKSFLIGNLKLLQEHLINIPDKDMVVVERLQSEGKTVNFAASGKELLAIIAVADPIKETSLEAIRKLKEKGLEVHMVTGDHPKAAARVAASAGIDHYLAGASPVDKLEYIKKLQAEGKKVAMTGDGINDAPALAQADMGIAMGTGTDVAMESAEMTLIKGSLDKLVTAIELSGRTMRTIRQNLFWAFFYNIIGIPIAAGVLFPLWGILLNPMIAGAAMAFSSVSVVSNSLRLRRVTL
jgi:Cu2+-exporting ATPase